MTTGVCVTFLSVASSTVLLPQVNKKQADIHLTVNNEFALSDMQMSELLPKGFIVIRIEKW